jgi:hypothetical protein
MIEVDGKVYRNLQEQVLENQKDIKNLQDNTYNKEEIDDALEEKADVSDVYDKTTADATFQTIAGMSNYALKDYIHQITLYNDNYASSGLHCFLTFNIRNNVSTPYTTAGQVYNALIAAYGENKFIGGSGYYQYQSVGYKEVLYNIYTRSNTDYILDAEYFEVDENFDSGSETIYLTNFRVKDIIL